MQIWKAKVEDAEVANTKKATSPAGTGHQVAGNRTLKTKREQAPALQRSRGGAAKFGSSSTIGDAQVHRQECLCHNYIL